MNDPLMIVGVDGSEAALRGVDAAVEIARLAQAKLMLVYVLQPFGGGTELEGLIPPEVQKQVEEGAKAIVARAAAHAPELPVEQLVLPGSPADTLADLAERRKAWMVVVGSRGRGAVARMLLGSVANRLVHLCHRPVLVVR